MIVKKIFLYLAAFTILGMPLSAAGGGKMLYASKCQGCHGSDGKGNTPVAKSLNGVGDLTVSRTKKELFEIISEGRGKMPAFGKSLSTNEIKSVVEYVQSFAD